MTRSKKPVGLGNMSKAAVFTLLLCLLYPTQSHAESLMQIYTAIQENDPAWQATQHAYEAGQQSKGIGRAYILPSVIASGEHKQVTDKPECDGDSTQPCSENEDEYDSSAYQLELVQPLFNKEKWHTYQEAKTSFELAEIEFESARQSNIYDTAVLYFEVLRAQEDYNLALAEQKALESQLKEIQAKADAGVADQTEVIETQASLDLATVNQITLLGLLKVTYEDLVTRTGINKPTVKSLSEDYPIEHLEPFDEQLWVNKAETNSPRLKSLNKNVELARQSFKRQTSGAFPTVDLFAQVSEQEQSGGRFIANGSNETYGVRVKWPIFAGMGDYYIAKQQRLQYMQNSKEARSEKQEFTQMIKNRFRSIYTDVLTVEARKKSVLSSERALRAVSAQYEIGSRDMIDVLNAQQQLFSAKQAYSHSRYNYVLDRMQLLLLAGELSEQELENLDQWLVENNNLLNLDTIP